MSARRALARAVKIAAAGLDVAHRPPPGIVVLLYHRVGGESELEVDLPTAMFDEQMAWLAQNRRVVPLAVALDELRLGDEERSTDVPSIVVTFDDGSADFVDVALPILARHRVPATLYVATAFIDERRPFPHGGEPASWAGLADACGTGFVDVGSHTHRHRLLDRASAADIADELDRSIGLIEDRLGRPAADFAYPKAVAGSADADSAVRSRFRSAALAGTRANPAGHTDPYRLARSPIQLADGSAWFRRKADGGMHLEDVLRQRFDRRRYAEATS